MKTLRVGIIGAGFTGQQHAEAIRRIPGTDVVALSDCNAKIAISKCEQLYIKDCYSDYKEMLSQPDIDVIHNCTPNNMHHPINKNIIRSKKHVFCEKPLAVSTQETSELLSLATQTGVAHGVNFNYRQNSMVQEMRQRVNSGDTGRIFMIHGHYLQDWLLYDTDYDWRMDPVIGGPSRAVADIGSHWFDLAQFVTGKRIQSVYANLMTMHPVRKHRSSKNETFSANTGELDEELMNEVKIASEDAAFITMKFEDGTPGLLVVSQVSAGRKNDISINIDSSEYSMEWQQERPDVLFTGHRNKPNQVFCSSPQSLTGDAKRYATLPAGHPVAWHDALRNGINEFYQSIRNNTYSSGTQNYATFKDGHRIVALTEACVESSKRNQWVTVAHL